MRSLIMGCTSALRSMGINPSRVRVSMAWREDRVWIRKGRRQSSGTERSSFEPGFGQTKVGGRSVRVCKWARDLRRSETRVSKLG